VPDEQTVFDIVKAQRGLVDLATEAIAWKRDNPADDLLTALINAEDAGDVLSDRELVAQVILLYVAGHETTVNLIGNGMFALLRRPDELARLRADPSLFPGAVEEFLRLDSPVNLATMRFTAEPVTIGGTEIPAGELVLLSLGSANRDPARYQHPDELDVRRDGGHLAFGHGIHFCLGAPLARLEGVVAFRVLLERFPTLTLAADPAELSWRPSTLLRGLTRLPVRLASARTREHGPVMEPVPRQNG